MSAETELGAPSFASMLRSPHQLVALSCGLGLFRHWPGTFGSVGGFVLFAILHPLPPPARIAGYGLLLALSVWACGRTGRELGDADHNSIVIDETFAMSLVLESVTHDLLLWPAAFLLFRLFDIYKPWPIAMVDRRSKGGFFVMLDDLLAAVYSIAVLRLLAWLIASYGH